MHIVTVKVVRVINNAVIYSFCPATYEKQLYARITHNFTHVEDRRLLEKDKKKLVSFNREGKTPRGSFKQSGVHTINVRFDKHPYLHIQSRLAPSARAAAVLRLRALAGCSLRSVCV